MLGLGLDKNLSSNAGFETFTGDWNKAQKTCRRGNLYNNNDVCFGQECQWGTFVM